MKIVLISELTGGGVEKVNTTLARLFVERGHSVTVISVTEKKNNNRFFVGQKPTFKIIFLEKPSRMASGFALLAALKSEKPQVIIVSSLMDLSFCLAFRNIFRSSARIVYVQHSVFTRSSLNGLKQRVKNEIIPKIFRQLDRIDGIVFVSRGVQEDFNTVFERYTTRQVVIYNPISIKRPWRYKPIEAKHLHLVTAGRLSTEKRQDVLIRAVASLNEMGILTTLDIFGEGANEPTLKALATQLKIKKYVNFKGYATNLSEAISKCDIFVLSSEAESFGNVLVEAMNLGMPVVSTNCPVGPSEILDGGKYGALIPVGDYNQLAIEIEATRHLYTKRIAERSYLRSLDFSEQESAQTYLSFIEEIVNNEKIN